MTEVELNLWRRFVLAAQSLPNDGPDLYSQNISRLLKLGDAMTPARPKALGQSVKQPPSPQPSNDKGDAATSISDSDVAPKLSDAGSGDHAPLQPSKAASAEIPTDGLVPKVKVLSLRSVNVREERAGAFFSSLTWKRHDPSAEPEQLGIAFEAQRDQPSVCSSRLFFAYQIPWSGRGTEPEGPQITEALSPVSKTPDILSLSDLATRQALQSAAKLKRREKDLVENYLLKPGQTGSSASFFQSIPWSEPRNRHKPQPVGATS
jgi:hypothetical protein